MEYLKDLLPSLIKQATKINSGSYKIEILISDNASTDGTDYYVSVLLKSNEHLTYYKNHQNIGSERNFASAIEKSRGKYVWLIGDDDLFEENSLSQLIAIIQDYEPTFIVCIDALKIVGENPAKYYSKAESKITLFDNYKKFLDFYSIKGLMLILAHTWIPSNIFLKEVFDKKISKEILPTDYSYMYALTNGLRTGGKICVVNTPIVKLRNVRAPHQYKDIPQKQEKYLLWLATTYNNKKIRNYVLKRKIKRIIRFPFSLSKEIVKRLLNTLHILNCS
jgi:glycosyltransferase involved in cell wall biosynthesis